MRQNRLVKIIASISVPLAIIGLLAFPRIGHTHEPITTKVMFNKEVIRILQHNCLGCHSPGHIKADIPLTTYDEARPWAKAIKEEILEKRMTPYQAAKGYGNFLHDYALPRRDLDLLTSWVEGGAPRGEEKDYPGEAIEELISGDNWPLGRPDLILHPEGETKIGAKGDDEVHCFLLPTNLNEDHWVEAFDFRPGNGKIVYSASFSIHNPRRRSSSPAKDTASERPGDCEIDGRRADLESLGQWVPGQIGNRLPPGTAHLLPANSRILMKIRYRKNGEESSDCSRIGLYFTRGPVNRRVSNIVINSPQTMIPANSDLYRIETSYPIGESAEVVAIRPLLFPFAKSIEATAYRPDGTAEVLIWARSYRFDWQPAYYFKRPVSLPKGTRLEITAYLDNSENNPNNPNDPSKPVKFANAVCEITLGKERIRNIRNRRN